MTDVYFSTNEADYAKLEGLYVSEKNPPGFIRGEDFGTVGMGDKCVRGPLTPLLVTNPGRFLEVYGGRDRTKKGTGGARIGQVHGALCNKKFGPVVVRRVAASDASKASHLFADANPTSIIRVEASSVGGWGLDITAQVLAATDADATHFNVLVTYLGGTELFENLNCQAGSDNTATVVGTDDGRLIDIVKLADGRPVNASSALATGGSDGTLVVGDYTAALDDLAVFPDISIVLVPSAITGSMATFHSHLVTLAASVNDREFLTWAGAHGQAVATEAAQVATQITTRSDRIWWYYNSAYTNDPDTQTEVQTAPHVWAASVLSQIDIDIHPGAFETVALLAGITRLTNNSLSRDDLISLKAAGISTLERNADGFQFRSAVTTSLEPGLEEQTRRRETDFLQLSASARLRHFVKAKNTRVTRATMAAELTAFSQGLRADTRVIEQFAIDQVSVNTDAKRAQGTEKLLWRVKLIDHILALVFETDIGTGVTIEQTAA